MNVRRADEFIADVERQFEWYVGEAAWEVAEQYLKAVEAACTLLGRYPQLGPLGRFDHPRLRDWRFLPVLRPFNKHIMFYEVTAEAVIMRRVLHGRRDLPRRLLEPPETP